MKKIYETPLAKIEELKVNDIIAASTSVFEDPDDIANDEFI